MFGPAYFVTTSKELMDEGTLAKLKIQCLVLSYTENERKLVSKMTYQEEMDWIVRNETRNKLINNLVKDLKGNTLVLFQFVEKHGRPLYEMIDKLDRKVFFVHGGTDTKTREEIRSITEDEKDAIIIASYGTFSTGINIRNIHNVVFASPSKSRIRVLQSIGRGLRRSESKDSIRLFDLSDDLSIKEHQNFTLRHFHARLNIYNQEEFNYKIDKVNI